MSAAIIFKEGRYLITRRSKESLLGDLWEFPGGKRQAEESYEECLRREIREELGIEVAVHDLFCEVLYPYPHSTVILYFYRCSIQAGEIQPLGCQEFRWVTPQALTEYAFPPTNVPIIGELIQTTKSL